MPLLVGSEIKRPIIFFSKNHLHQWILYLKSILFCFQDFR